MANTPKLTEDQVEAIRALFDDPRLGRPSYADVAEHYGLHKDTVRKIVNFQRRLGLGASIYRAGRRKPPGVRLTWETVKAMRLAFFAPGEASRPTQIAKRFGVHPSTVHYYLRNAHPDEPRRKG